MSDAPAAPPPQDDKLFVPSGPTAPPVEPSAADMPVSSALFRRPPHLRAVLRAGLYALVVALLLPYLLVPLYAFVTPPSTPMLWRYLTGQRVVRTVVALEEVASAILWP